MPVVLAMPGDCCCSGSGSPEFEPCENTLQGCPILKYYHLKITRYAGEETECPAFDFDPGLCVTLMCYTDGPTNVLNAPVGDSMVYDLGGGSTVTIYLTGASITESAGDFSLRAGVRIVYSGCSDFDTGVQALFLGLTPIEGCDIPSFYGTYETLGLTLEFGPGPCP